MKDRPKFRLADEESKDVRATLPQAYYSLILGLLPPPASVADSNSKLDRDGFSSRQLEKAQPVWVRELTVESF